MPVLLHRPGKGMSVMLPILMLEEFYNAIEGENPSMLALHFKIRRLKASGKMQKVIVLHVTRPMIAPGVP